MSLVVLIVLLFLQWRLTRTAFEAGRPRRVAWVLSILGYAWLAAGFLTRFYFFKGFLPDSSWSSWIGGLTLIYTMFLLLWTAFDLAVSWTPFDPHRRRAMTAVAPAALCGYGVFIERHALQLREVDLEIPRLPPDLEGLRIVQLTDIHFGPYFGRRDLSRAIEMANETRADIAVVTGDLISTRRDPLNECLELLTRLRADSGVYGCMGNHERYARCEDHVWQQGLRGGAHYLREEAVALRFGNAQLNLAGVDYQGSGRPYLTAGESLHRPGMVNILLSHNPNVFPAAVQQGWNAVLSGHTHGGQVKVEILGEHFSPARYLTPYIRGTYREAGASIYVSCGLGCIGAPIRLATPPEVNLIRLCAISS